MTDHILDQYLLAWAAQNALAPERADAIRRAIRDAPPVAGEILPPGWWHQFSGALATTLQKSAQRSPFPPLFSPLPVPAVP